MRRGPADCALRPEIAFSHRPRMVAAALAGVLGMSASASAKTCRMVPSLSLGAIFDDNLFFNDARLAAAGLRAGPALSLECKPTERFQLLGRTGLDSEYFGDPRASSWAARRNAGLTARYRLGPLTTVSLSGDYALTAYAAELLPSVGLDYGRRFAESIGGTLELEHRVNSKIVLRGGYGVQTFQLEGSSTGLRSQLSSDTEFVFLVAPHTTLRLQVGPRYLAGSFSPHVAGTLERVRSRARVAVGYERGRILAFDRTLVVESYAARFSYRVSPALTVGASPALFRQWDGPTEQRSWHIGGSALCRARSWLSMFANYAYVVQDRGTFINPLNNRSGPPQIWRNTLAAGFIVAPRSVREQPKQ